MENVQNIQNRIMELLKHISLRQISKRSGLSYLTLHNIKSGKSKMVTPRVAKKFAQFEKVFLKTLDNVASVKQAAGEAPAKETKKKIPVAKTETTMHGSRKLAIQAARAQKKSPAWKRGRKPVAAAETPVTVKSAHAASPVPVLLGEKLNDEITALEIRLNYLRAMQKAETEYLRALGKIKR
ncbi:MAG: hypothetical protein QHI48_05685 [Bacteroidota bacterium]|nr:hypothetical protein [Bacteroidota bacterium]